MWQGAAGLVCAMTILWGPGSFAGAWVNTQPHSNAVCGYWMQYSPQHPLYPAFHIRETQGQRPEWNRVIQELHWVRWSQDQDLRDRPQRTLVLQSKHNLHYTVSCVVPSAENGTPYTQTVHSVASASKWDIRYSYHWACMLSNSISCLKRSHIIYY